MLVRETVRTAWRSLSSNRLRTTLTSLGMVIGVAAVVAVLAIGEGARASVEGRIRSLGTNLLLVRPQRAQTGGVRGGRVETLVPDDADALAALTGVIAAAPEQSGSAQVKFLSSNVDASIVGTTPDYLGIRSLELAAGIGLTDLDVQGRRRVAVLGGSVATELFGSSSGLGERIQIGGHAFRVVGILEAKGDAGWMSPDDQIIVPLTTFQSVISGEQHLSSISVQVESEERSAEARARIEQLLRLRHRIRPGAEDDFEVRSQTEMLETMGEITGTFTALLGSIAAVSLLVGGIGIMNIMLVSVQERTREIGIRIAVGARRRDVLLQFLVEAIIVSLFGGLLGIALGYGAAVFIGRYGGWETIVPSYAVVLALATSIAVGLIFGVGPARRAAHLDPVEALRHE